MRPKRGPRSLCPAARGPEPGGARLPEASAPPKVLQGPLGSPGIHVHLVRRGARAQWHQQQPQQRPHGAARAAGPASGAPPPPAADAPGHAQGPRGPRPRRPAAGGPLPAAPLPRRSAVAAVAAPPVPGALPPAVPRGGCGSPAPHTGAVRTATPALPVPGREGRGDGSGTALLPRKSVGAGWELCPLATCKPIY